MLCNGNSQKNKGLGPLCGNLNVRIPTKGNNVFEFWQLGFYEKKAKIYTVLPLQIFPKKNFKSPS